MLAHLHTVIKVEQSVGLAWLQYNWRTRKELCAAGSLAWGKQDPWQLLACIPHNSTAQDPFDVTPQDIRPRQPPASGSVAIQGMATGASGQNHPRTPGHRGGICRLFNRAPAGCIYGEECIFTHRYSICRRTDHGRRGCLKGDRGGSDRLRQGVA